MPCDWNCYKGLTLPSSEEISGEGGEALRDNFVRLVDSLSGDGLQYSGSSECETHTLSVHLVEAGGLAVDESGGIEISLSDDPGMELDSSGSLRVKNGCGITRDSSGISLDASSVADSAAGMENTSGCKLGAKIATAAGLEFDGSGRIAISLTDSNAGLEFDEGGGLKAKAGCGLATDSTGVTFDAAEVADSNSGIENASGCKLGVKLGTDGGLHFDGSGGLAVDIGCGLTVDSNELSVDNSTLAGTSSGLQTRGTCGLAWDPASVSAGNGISVAATPYATTVSADVSTPITTLGGRIGLDYADGLKLEGGSLEVDADTGISVTGAGVAIDWTSLIDGQSEGVSTNDLLAFYDASATQHRKISLSSLLGNGLDVASGDLVVRLNTSAGLGFDGTGEVQLELGTNDALAFDSGGSLTLKDGASDNEILVWDSGSNTWLTETHWVKSGSDLYHPGKVMVGSSSNPSAPLHILTSTDEKLRLEDTNGTTHWSLNVPNNDQFQIENGGAGTQPFTILSNAPDNSLVMGASGVGLGLTPSVPLELSLSTENLGVVDSGSTGATEQDWIEVQVGGSTGYIRVYSSK